MENCTACGTVGVPSQGPIPWDVDATTAELADRVAAGRMRVLRGEVALTDMTALLESELKYTVASFLSCEECGRILFWGLSIRGNPILRHADLDEVERRPWQPIPPRESWAH
ncbi:hypothetical protein [Parenemella sanctibonifatiensis]|uniref:Uncharacterized protein n=1 Tax=Parenemella sanctibonifatiensis TaxID=2016505 RepID=A0A255ED75_9ACTN|nr:hypothetical protein [Parenemella sanctibonifatiensis]OYN88871.1 hypothetical protein CGZ92_03995 [Parenemella sanctibonifatiensis]